jgi:cytochrome P450
VFMAGPSACERWLDPSLITRKDALPPPVATLFGGRSVALMDGDEHLTRKRLLLAAFSREALEGYQPVLQRLIASRLAEWATKGELNGLKECQRLSFEGIASTIFGLSPGPDVDALLADYGKLLAGFSALPIPLPFTTFGQAVAARDRILAFFTSTVEKRQAAGTQGQTDGVARLLNARTADGKPIAPGDLVLELHHIVIAGFIIYAELVATLQVLAENPAVRSKLLAEVKAMAPSGPLSAAQVSSLPYLRQVVMEVKRFCPNVPIGFGRAKTTFEFNGARVPEGFRVFLAVGENNRVGYSLPDSFDPDRFSPQRAEDRRHDHSFVPQGPGPAESHRCLGYDFTTQFMALFALLLVRDYRWEIPPQNLGLRWNLVPPEPIDGLRTRIARA